MSSASDDPQASPKAPSELWDMIHDHLHDDKATLKAASLVCKTWTPSSRYHLFYTLVCTPESHGKTLLLLDRHVTILPHLAACVRALKLHGALEATYASCKPLSTP
ncbi:hypothetical protein C8T65DRAFT_592089 [Cerioporus squamosus]|nr:hypothetical protein C8T65DRAFT_592089 [Cerioporus squamosus]